MSNLLFSQDAVEAELHMEAAAPVWDVNDDLGFSADHLIDGGLRTDQRDKICYHSEDNFFKPFVNVTLETPMLVRTAKWLTRSNFCNNEHQYRESFSATLIKKAKSGSIYNCSIKLVQGTEF